jgi:hypothetical protein
MGPYLGVIIIGVEVTRLYANIDGAELSLRSSDVAPTPGVHKRPLGLRSCVRYIYIVYILGALGFQ